MKKENNELVSKFEKEIAPKNKHNFPEDVWNKITEITTRKLSKSTADPEGPLANFIINEAFNNAVLVTNGQIEFKSKTADERILEIFAVPDIHK